MWFLLTDIGNEDILLGYPWLATYELKFSWRHGMIDKQNPPIVPWTVNPRMAKIKPVVACLLMEVEKYNIVQELCIDSSLTSIATDLAIIAKPKEEVVIPKWYTPFTKVFSEAESKKFPPLQPWDHEIKFKPGTPDAINCKIYTISQAEDVALNEFIDEQLKKGYICPSKSPFVSSFFFIKKCDGKLRPIQDYCIINQHMVCNQYPLPLMSDLICNLGGVVIYTKLDIRRGYNNMQIKEGHKHKASFKTQRGLFEPTVMFFGLYNSPATFQTMMNYLLEPLIIFFWALGTEIAAYTDNVGIATYKNDEEAHKKAVMAVLELADMHNLYFKPEKCIFHAPLMDYLGVILEKGVMCMDPVKIVGIKNWPMPQSVKEVCSWHGFCNFYHPFVWGFTAIMLPLNVLTRKDAPWQWGVKEQCMFNTMGECIT